MTPSPRQTADDLRSAARLVRTHGHATHEYVDPMGRVCAVGAIGLATGSFQRLQLSTGFWDFGHTGLLSLGFDERTTAAADALAPLLPTVCADGRCCPPPKGDTPYTMADEFHERIKTHPHDIVFHFNDFICEGGEELATLLDQAAEKIEADLP